MRRLAPLAAMLLAAAAPASAAGPIGVITELSISGGPVEVKAAAGEEWQPARPLLSIGAGDQIRASGAGRAVLVFVATQGTTVVTSANSPYVVIPPAQPRLSERVQAALGFLQSPPRDSTRRSLAVRTPPEASPVSIVAPRETHVAAERISLEWVGADGPYTVRVRAADDRVLWEKRVGAGPLTVSPAEVRLGPGRYRWELESAAHGTQRVGFDVATPDAAAQASAGAAAVDAAGYPAATAALLKAAAFMRERFDADARRELLRGLAASPDEPALHLLLGEVYDRTGLDNLAAAEYDRAEALSGGR